MSGADLARRRDALDALPSAETLLRQEGWRPRKELGQHFIVDADVTDRIVFAHGDLTGKRVAEIGPGAGTLTRSLLRCDVARIDAIEKDPWAADVMRRRIAPASQGALIVREEDALQYDYGADGEKIHVVANLPYNISSELLMRWLGMKGRVEAATVMVQREVAERFSAMPGDNHYGRPAVKAYLFADVEIVADVPPETFVPPPKVLSSVLHMRFRETPRVPVSNVNTLETVVKAAFATRRKTLRNGLRGHFPHDVDALLTACGVDGSRRAETVSPEEFCCIANAWEARTSHIKPLA
ncbi:MAG: 16S rRNA (adenine(1518)-N(6)/adenine(1519)-N(6))-dimethyltransferase RsmA [Rickettsiales bacterium]